MKLTDFNTDASRGYIEAIGTIVKDDLVQTDALSGKGFRANVVDYAAAGQMTYGTAQTTLATGRLFAEVTVAAGVSSAYNRQAVVKDSQGNIYTLAPVTGSNSLRLYKYSALGVSAGSQDIDLTAAIVGNPYLFWLSNGALGIVYGVSNNLKYAIYNADLTVVIAATSILVATMANPYFAACALSGGGFAVIYENTTNPLISRFATYDNAGTAVLTATDIWTRTGTTGAQYNRMVQLSNGNLAIATSSTNSVSSIGLFYGVVTISGGSVMAFTSLDVGSVSWAPEMVSNGAGYFAISRYSVANGQMAWVFNNAGVQQGANQAFATSSGGAANKTKLLASGGEFYLLWHRSSDSKAVITFLNRVGPFWFTTRDITTSNTTQHNNYIDAFAEDGYIVGMSMTGTGTAAPMMWVINIASLELVNSLGTTFGTLAGTTNGIRMSIISGGGRAFISVYDNQSTSATRLIAGKWANTAILGTAAADTAIGALIPLNVLPGAYKTTPMGGSSLKAFDITTNPIGGNKGTMVGGNSVILQGIGA